MIHSESWTKSQLRVRWSRLQLPSSKTNQPRSNYSPNLAIAVHGPLKKWWKSRKERWSCWESNTGPQAYCASALPLRYSSHQQPPATCQHSCPYVASSSILSIVSDGSRVGLLINSESWAIIRVVVGGSCSSVAEHWHEKPNALGSANLEKAWVAT